MRARMLEDIQLYDIYTSQVGELGVMTDNRLNFKGHMEYICKKANALANSLTEMMPNIGGLRQSYGILISRLFFM